MTWEKIQDLPGLVRRKEFLEATGLTSRELSAKVAAGEVAPVYVTRKSKLAKYRKVDILKICGLKV